MSNVNLIVLGFLFSISKACGVLYVQLVFLHLGHMETSQFPGTQKLTMDFTEMCERKFVSENTFQIDFPKVGFGLFS